MKLRIECFRKNSNVNFNLDDYTLISKYPKFTKRTSVSNWKNKCKTGGNNFVFKKDNFVLNIDQTLLSYVFPGQHTSSFKGSNNIPIE